MRPQLNRALTFLAIFLPWGMLASYLAIFWSYSPQYQYGWLVIPMGLRLFWLRWNSLAEKPLSEGIGAGAAIALFSMMLAPLWLIRQATTHWSVPGYGLTALVVGYTLSLLALMGGWKLSRQLLISVIFIFCAVKLPLTPEQWIIQSLSRFVASASVEVLYLLGIPAISSGNMVILNTGIIGISEACSGINSLQSLFMVALFLGEERRMRIPHRLLMIALGATLSISLNVVRILILSMVCLRNGMTDFEEWHDGAGWTILIVSLGVMMFVANSVAGGPKTEGNGGPRNLRKLPNWLAGSLAAWFIVIVVGSESWFRVHDHHSTKANHVEIQWPSSLSSFVPVPIPDRVRDITLCSGGQSGRWKEGDDTEWTLSILEFGGEGKGISQWAPMHTPDICFPAAGMPLLKTFPPTKFRTSGRELKFHSWEFKRQGGSVFVFYCRNDKSNPDEKAPFFQDILGWSRVLEGRRNLGLQTVEFAVTGYNNYSSALRAVRNRFPDIVTIDK